MKFCSWYTFQNPWPWVSENSIMCNFTSPHWFRYWKHRNQLRWAGRLWRPWAIRFSALPVCSQKLLSMENWSLRERAFTVERDKMICILPGVFMVTNHSRCCHSVTSAWIFYNFFSFSERHSFFTNSAGIHLKEIKYHIFQGRKAEGRKAMTVSSLCILVENQNWIHTGLFSLIFSLCLLQLSKEKVCIRHLIVLRTERWKTEGCGGSSLRLGLQ